MPVINPDGYRYTFAADGVTKMIKLIIRAHLIFVECFHRIVFGVRTASRTLIPFALALVRIRSVDIELLF